MKSNAVSSSMQSFGISERSSTMRLKQKRYVAFFVAGILVSILVGFLLGYFVPKCDDNSTIVCSTNETNSNTNSHINEQRLLAALDRSRIENISRLDYYIFYILYIRQVITGFWVWTKRQRPTSFKINNFLIAFVSMVCICLYCKYFYDVPCASYVGASAEI